jgi:tRNA dimethylallyltransferase
MGPTASGKTQLALEIIERFSAEIISVDSAMVYRGMDIGTAKPSKEILQKIPHHLIDMLDPAESYSVAQFRKDAMCKIESILERGKIPLLVGGTMLYFRVLQKGISELPAAHSDIRLALQEQADQIGWPALHEVLLRIDPIAANKIHPHDSQRIQRALEVYESTGKTMTAWQQEGLKLPAKFQVINLIVAPSDRSVLHDCIQRRFNHMLQIGLMDEVKKLYDRGDLNLDNPSIRSVGYRQVWDYLLGLLTYEEMRERGIIATRQLAKRQLTWLRHWENATWFDTEKNVMKEVMKFIEEQCLIRMNKTGSRKID